MPRPSMSKKQSDKLLYAQKKYPQFKLSTAPKKPQKQYRQHSSSFMPVWTCQIANYLFYRKFLQAYKAEKMMIYQIKWAKNMGASSKRPQDYIKVIKKLESQKAIKSGTGVYFGYDDKDIVNYFMRDGLEIQGNANGFIKSSGIGTELIATLDVAKILNPFSYLDSISVGNVATVSLSLSPTTRTALAAKYDKNNARFILQHALPDQKCLTSRLLQGYMDKCFWNMKGFKIDKSVAASFELGVVASAGISLGDTIDKEVITNKFKKLRYDAFYDPMCDIGVTLSAATGSGRNRVESLIFVANKAAYFSDNRIMRKGISKDVLNVLHPYDLEKNLKYKTQKSILNKNYNNYQCRIRKFDDYPAYVYILTTTSNSKLDLGKATLISRLRLKNQVNANLRVGDGTYFRKKQEFARFNALALGGDLNAQAHIFEHKTAYKNRKSRLCLPFRPYPNSKKLYIYNQDTEILYTKERAYSFMGYKATMNALCSLSLEYRNAPDQIVEDDLNWEFVKNEIIEPSTAYSSKNGYIGKKTNTFAENSLYSNSIYSENTMMYTSINHIFRIDREKECKGSSFTIGRSIDLTTLTIFYDKYFILKKLISKTSARSLKFLLNRKDLSISDCLRSKSEFLTYLQRAKDVLKSTKETSQNPEKKQSFFQRLTSLSSSNSLSQTRPQSTSDTVLANFSVEKFKSLSANSGMRRRKTVTAIDKALKRYWDHVQKFNNGVYTYASDDVFFEEINARTGLLLNIKDECLKWKNSHKFTNVRRQAVDNLMRACNASVKFYTAGSMNIKSFKIRFQTILEYQKLLVLFKPLEVMFEALKISKRVGLEYILPGTNHRKSKGVIGLIYDLVGRENIKAAIFETVFDVNVNYLSAHIGNKVYYYSKDQGKDFKDISLPTSNYLKYANEKTNVGFRIIFRREDSFENRTNIFQLGTRLMPLQSRQKFDINLSFSYQHQQSAFTGISLYSASNPWRKSKNIDDYYKTILVS
ncbi:MAG: hypothetical protein GY750_18210 [Lentisphaerae bacterium]|nr:hypothetical protein [Lentisphaerota bacterium]MCP4103331.1 hypothetical protein [Lentisphaerota bacterium]